MKDEDRYRDEHRQPDDDVDVMDALEELWRENKVDVVPGIGEDAEPAFALTDEGLEYGEELLRNNDAAVLMLVNLHLERHLDDYDSLAELLMEFGEFLRDEPGVNMFRVFNRNPDAVPFIETPIPDEMVQELEPQEEP